MLDFSCEFYGSSSKRMKQVFFFFVGHQNQWASPPLEACWQGILMSYTRNFPSFCGIPTSIPRSGKFSQEHRLLIHSVIVAEA